MWFSRQELQVSVFLYLIISPFVLKGHKLPLYDNLQTYKKRDKKMAATQIWVQRTFESYKPPRLWGLMPFFFNKESLIVIKMSLIFFNCHFW